MGKHRIGPITYTMKATKGPEINPYNFYSTSYSTNFGKERFVPRTTRHLGTGYVTNMRPAIYYSETLDNFDNVPMMKLLHDNYVTTYQKSHKPSYESDGKDMLPSRVIKSESGFTRPAPQGTADYKTVYETRAAQIDMDEKHKPYLHKINLKRVPPIDIGSMGLITQNDVSFEKKERGWLPDHQKDIGKKEVTGFTNCHELDPVEHLPKVPYIWGSKTSRPTASTVNQQTFFTYSDANGKEANKGLCLEAQRSTGFTSNQKAKPRYVDYSNVEQLTKLDQVPSLTAERIQKNDPAEYFNLDFGPEKKSLSQATYRGKMSLNIPGRCDVVGKRKELSGAAINNRPYNESKTLPNNFTTNYEVKYLHVPKLDRYVNRGDTEKLPDGFTKGTSVHKFGDGINFREEHLESHLPIVTRRIKAEEPCYTTRFKNYKWNT